MSTKLPTEPTGEQLWDSRSISYRPSDDGFRIYPKVAIDIARDRGKLLLRTPISTIRFNIVDLRGRVVEPIKADAPYADQPWVAAALDYVAFHMEDD